MFEEPYRWVEAIQNRRDYLEEQLKGGSPVIAVSYDQGILFATVGKGSAKLFEIYDLIALGGMGHPADLEKLRNVVLDISHVEGFNRSPGDVTIRRLMKFGLAPMVKQAFEEVLHAPYIVKILMAEINPVTGKRLFLRLNYDGVIDEGSEGMVLSGTAEMTRRMESYFQKIKKKPALSFDKGLQSALRTWAVSIAPLPEDGNKTETLPDNDQLGRLLKKHLKDHQVEVVLLDQKQAGSAKYRVPSQQEIQTGIKGWL